MTQDIYILGTGGHARDVWDVALALGYRPIFVGRGPDEVLGWTTDDPIVSEAEALVGSNRLYAIGVGDNRARVRLAERFRDRGDFPTLVHPDTSFGRGARAAADRSRGSVIFAGARFTNSIILGDFVTVNLGATVSHDVEMGDYVNLSPGAHIAGNVKICDGAWIGIGVAVNQGLPERKRVIGAWTTIGSGAVVTDDCAPDSVYVGIPARKIR